MNNGSILVVDDQFEELNLIITFLLEAFPDYKLFDATNGKMGWEIIKEHRPDLVLTDWDMPELNGVQLIQLMKGFDHLKDIPVIVVTGTMTTSDDLKQALDIGSIDYVRKPIDFVELKARVQSALRMYHAHKKIQEQHEMIQSMLQADKDRLSLEVETKARKLSTLTLFAAEKNNLLIRVEQKLIDIIPLLNLHSSEQQDIKVLVRELKRQGQLDSGWEAFKLQFEEVHPRFFQDLKLHCANLTAQDLKISAYLKLRLDNKEIASLLNITTASVRKSTYRLKKKLALDEDASIRDFIHQIG